MSWYYRASQTVWHSNFHMGRPIHARKVAALPARSRTALATAAQTTGLATATATMGRTRGAELKSISTATPWSVMAVIAQIAGATAPPGK